MLVDQVRKEHPETRRLLAKYGLKSSDYGFSVEQFARRTGVDLSLLLDELNRAVDENLRIRLEQEG